MAYIDHHDVFFGTTDDGCTFAVVNADLPGAHRILIQSGFTAHEQHGRTWCRLPPGTSRQDADEATGLAFMQLLAKTMNIAELTSTPPSATQNGEEAAADVYFDLTGPYVTAAARTEDLRSVLEQYGFRPAPAGHVLPPGTSEADAITAVDRAEAHLYTTGASIQVTLGIPAPDAAPPTVTANPSAAAQSAQPPQPRRHQR